MPTAFFNVVLFGSKTSPHPLPQAITVSVCSWLPLIERDRGRDPNKTSEKNVNLFLYNPLLYAYGI